MNIINIIFFTVVVMILSLSCSYLLDYNNNQKINENFSEIDNTADVAAASRKIDTTREKVGKDKTEDQNIEDSNIDEVMDAGKDCRCPCKRKWCSELCPMAAGQDPLGYWHPPRTDWSSFYHKTY